jgi:hypothetical protein
MSSCIIHTRSHRRDLTRLPALGTLHRIITFEQAGTTATIRRYNGSEESALEIAISDATIQIDLPDTASGAAPCDLLRTVR